MNAEPMPLLESGAIGKVLSSTGPVVKCVVLKASMAQDNDSLTGSRKTNDSDTQHDVTDGRESSCNTNEEASNVASRILLREHMEEIEIDTTPSRSIVSRILGGPVTFLGQYEEEGTVLMIRKLPADLEAEELPDLKLTELKALCEEREISMDQMLDKSALIQGLTAWSTRAEPPYNLHQLQPPLHKERVRGDILIIKVAESKEELDSEDSTTHLEVPNNEEFFLDYTLDEYIKFASRTDIPEYEVRYEEDEEESADEQEEHDHLAQGMGNQEDDEEGLPLRLGDEDEIDDEDRAAMFNLVMNEVLRQYREENGRGPDTKELLEMRATIAGELDVTVAHIDADQADWNKHAKDGTPAKENAKTIGFHDEDKVREYQPDPDEHNHLEDYDEQNDDDDDDESGDDDDDDDDDADSSEPPRKRQKISGKNTEEVADSKPAAKPADVSKGNDSPTNDGEGNMGDNNSGTTNRAVNKSKNR